MSLEKTKKSRKNLIWWAASGTLFLLLFALYLSLYPPLPIVPEIGRNLSSNFEQAEKEFTHRVKKVFPAQTKETYIIHNLEKQGFLVNRQSKEAIFSKFAFPCRMTWRIHWSSEKEEITKVNASYAGSCL